MSRFLPKLLCLASIAAAVTALGTSPAAAQDRMPPLRTDQMTDAQRDAVEELRRTRGVELRGPWHPLLRSPEVLARASAMGEYLRYRSALEPRLREFLILLTASEWRQQYEWRAHHALGLEAGLSEATAAAIADGRRPGTLTEDETALYDLFAELNRYHSVSDASYQAAVGRFGEQGVIDAVSIIGYYTLLAMVMNTAQTALPQGATPMLPARP